MAITLSSSEPVYPLRIAASRVGLSPRTLRVYETAGLIAPARVGGHSQRLYSGQDLHWLRCVRDMIHGEGLTVTAIRRLLDLVPCWEIRHCEAEQAAACAPSLNIPDMAAKAQPPAESPSAAAEAPPSCGQVELKLIYGVKEFGAILTCSRCNHAERILRKVAANYDHEVIVTKVDISSEEAAGVLLPPVVLVDHELLASGQGVSEARLQRAIERHLKSKR
jgi:MerR family transcriptional regulator/heat shock protein HspR